MPDSQVVLSLFDLNLDCATNYLYSRSRLWTTFPPFTQSSLISTAPRAGRQVQFMWKTVTSTGTLIFFYKKETKHIFTHMFLRCSSMFFALDFVLGGGLDPPSYDYDLANFLAFDQV